MSGSSAPGGGSFTSSASGSTATRRPPPCSGCEELPDVAEVRPLVRSHIEEALNRSPSSCVRAASRIGPQAPSGHPAGGARCFIRARPSHPRSWLSAMLLLRFRLSSSFNGSPIPRRLPGGIGSSLFGRGGAGRRGASAGPWLCLGYHASPSFSPGASPRRPRPDHRPSGSIPPRTVIMSRSSHAGHHSCRGPGVLVQLAGDHVEGLGSAGGWLKARVFRGWRRAGLSRPGRAAKPPA